MDPIGYAAPARLNTLVIPAGTLEKVQFDAYYSRLCYSCEVQLLDVRLPTQEGSTSLVSNQVSRGLAARQFDPKNNPTSRITYAFSTALVPDYLKPLFDLEPWRRQFLVFGLAHFSSTSPENLSQILFELRERYLQAIYHVVLVFDVPNDPSSTQSWPAGAFPVHSTNFTSLESTLSSITTEFLGCMTNYWASRNLNSFQSPAVLVDRSAAKQHRHSPSNISIGRHGSISMQSSERAKSRQDGRTLKYLGNLHLLCGLVPDALAELGDAAAILRDQGDHLWFGSALSDIALCLVILRYEGNPAGIPSTAVAAAWSIAAKSLKNRRNPLQESSHAANSDSPRHSTHLLQDSSPRSSVSIVRTSSLHKSRPFTGQSPLEDLLEHLQLASLEEYSLGKGSELASYTVYYETIARFVNLLMCLRAGWSKGALASAIRARPVKDDIVEQFPQSPNRTAPQMPVSSVITIQNWTAKIYDLSLSEFSPDTQVRVLGTVAQLYAKAGLKRKWAFVCVQIVSLLASSRATVDTGLGHVEDVLRVYSKWPKLEAAMLRNLVALGLRTRNAHLQTDAASRLLGLVCSQRFFMMEKEQMTLYHLIRSYGEVVQSAFWDKAVLVDASIKTHKLTTVRSKSRHHSVSNSDAPSSLFKLQQGDTSANGIIYNPFEGTEFKEEGRIERGTPTSAKICLRNPLAIEIQVFELALVDAQGNRVSEVVKDFVIPAQTPQFLVEAQVIPGDEPQLEVTGCLIKVSGCASMTVDLPSPKNIPIIPARPVLILQNLSLLKGWTMLLEGEKRQFSIELWNSSLHTPSSILHFGFNDSTLDPLRQAVAKQDTSRTDFYEYEYFLHKRRAINLIEEHIGSIGPRSSKKFNFDLYGKRGVTSAAILVDYGMTGDNLRRLKIPFQVTICQSISVDRVSILPSKTPSSVLLLLDLRNTWTERLKCKVWADAEKFGASSKSVTHWIDAGTSRRFFVNVPWLPLNFEDMQRPIPRFSKRQYTVDTKTTPEQLQMFWLREKLLSKLHGIWSTSEVVCLKSKPLEGERIGYIELRTIQLTCKMAEMLKADIVEVIAKPLSHAEIDTPTALILNLENKSKQPMQGMLRLIPDKAAMRYMLVVGASQILVSIPAEGRIEAEFKVLFLSHGPFVLSTVFDPLAEKEGPALPSVFQTQKTVVHV